LLEQCFDHHQRLAAPILLIKHFSQPDLEGIVIAGLRQRLPILLLGLIEPAQREQGFGEMSPQRKIIGRHAQTFA
jgi:hypothetical protein